MNVSIFKSGGPVFLIICLAGLAALAIFIERIVKLRQARIRYEDFLNGVFNILEKGKVVVETNGERKEFEVEGGFCEQHDNLVIICVEK